MISGEQVTYTYDSLNRLATAVTTDNPNVTQWGQSYTYDGFGNLTNQNVIKGSIKIAKFPVKIEGDDILIDVSRPLSPPS